MKLLMKLLIRNLIPLSVNIPCVMILKLTFSGRYTVGSFLLLRPSTSGHCPLLTILGQDDQRKEPALWLHDDTGVYNLRIYGNKHKHQLLGFVTLTGIFPDFLGIVDPNSHPLSHRNLNIYKKNQNLRKATFSVCYVIYF